MLANKWSLILFIIYLQATISLETCYIKTFDGRETSSCPSLHNCIDEFCIHKSVFPITTREAVGSFIAVLVSGLANSGGIGGGTLLTSLMLTLFNYSTNKSISIVYCMLFGASLGSFLSVCRMKDKDTKKPLINYDVALICLPLMLLGTNLGMILSRSLPSILTLIGMVIVNSIILKKTFVRAVKEYNLETQHKNMGSISPLRKKNQENNQGLEMLTFNDASEYYLIQENPSFYNSILNERHLLPMDKIKEILYLVGILMLLTLIRGSSTTPSLIGISYCSFNYWIVYVIGILSCIFFSKRNLSLIRQRVGPYQDDADVIIIFNYKIPNFTGFRPDKIQSLVNISLFAGILSGMMIGGGILLNSHLLGMLTPQSTAATMTLFLMLPFFMTTFSTVVAGRIQLDEFIWFVGLAIVASFVISKLFSYFINKYQRQSILLIAICGVLLIVQFVVPTYGIAGIYSNPVSMLSFHSICT